MLTTDIIKIEYESQGFSFKQYGISPDGSQSVLIAESTRKTRETYCPICLGTVYIHDAFNQTLKDIPILPGMIQSVFCSGHRYRCQKCSHTFNENIPFAYPGTRITNRAANWIKGFLKNKISIKSIQNLTGIHWETIRNVQKEMMEAALCEREEELKRENYKPTYLAVDEFAIHKGHKYATCVMDLETGDVLWVGKGRTIADFEKFFEEVSPDTLSAVRAVAMDMNASYNSLVEKHLPNADIVYDRYHMQAQFGKDVLGVVRLDEARKHQAKSKKILAEINDDDDKDVKKDLKEQAKLEKSQYSVLKKSRWTLLMNSNKLSEERADSLKQILEKHQDLAICYAMKEEMCRLFQLKDYDAAFTGWSAWFTAAKESNIPALVKFAEQKEKRINGLVAHAVHPISTGKLEGFNNKIKVAKRIAYGYRNEDYFFTLIRYLSIPAIRSSFPIFP